MWSSGATCPINNVPSKDCQSSPDSFPWSCWCSRLELHPFQRHLVDPGCSLLSSSQHQLAGPGPSIRLYIPGLFFGTNFYPVFKTIICRCSLDESHHPMVQEGRGSRHAFLVFLRGGGVEVQDPGSAHLGAEVRRWEGDVKSCSKVTLQDKHFMFGTI